MKVTAVICEYNPFHNGHAYQLAEARRRTKADHVICLMSGDFVQRGTPAIFSKYDRAACALSAGADLVLELPVLWATSSADYFAQGAVSILEGIGCVDALSFGAECEDLVELQTATALLHLAEDSDIFKETLDRALRRGKTFAAARTEALDEFCKTDCGGLSCGAMNSGLLSSPNNILAISYLNALSQSKSSIEPVAIARKGSGYHDDKLQGEFSSATALREVMAGDMSSEALRLLSDNMPAACFDLISEQIHSGGLLTMNDFSSILYYALLQSSAAALAEIADGGSDLANRVLRLLASYTTAEAFAEELKTKQLTRTRVNRFLLHAILQLSEDLRTSAQTAGYAPYARVLGMRKDAAELLSVMHRASGIPIITNLAKDAPSLTGPAAQSLALDVKASDLYMKMLTQKTGESYPTEYTRKFLVK